MSSIEDRYLASLCLLARWRGAPTRSHPARCAMCLRPLEELEALVSAPVVATDVSTWSRLTKHEKASRLDAARTAAIAPPSWIDSL